jgi:hypothetical protein
MGFDIENNKPLPTQERYNHVPDLATADIN